MSPTGERLTGEERREAILGSSLALFARHGLHGVTTRMIADGAGVSEALLYRHFKSKDELYGELQRWCMGGTIGRAERIAVLESSTATLVFAVHFLMTEIARPPADKAMKTCLKRLILSSLLEDGSFARNFIRANVARFVPRLVECVEAAGRAGDLVARPSRAGVRLWMAHHLAAALANFRLPDAPAIDYGVPYDEVVDEAIHFALRGLGLEEAAIRRHASPRAIAAFARRLEQEGDPT